MPKLTFEQRQQLIEEYTKEIDALNDSLPETIPFYELEKTIEKTGQRILSKTLETLASTPNMGISPPMPTLFQTSSKKRN